LLDEAMELTKNRLSILDISNFGAIPSWYFSKDMDESSVLYSFGWAYQGAHTIDNIVSINEALQGGFYEYVFDRSLELGDDTILISKKLVPEENVEKMKSVASQMGFTLYDENKNVWLYHLDEAKGTFGVVKKYRNLAMGEHAQNICYIYPQFQYAENHCLDEYTIDELAQYEKIYLSGFTYHDKKDAEELLRQLSEKGVKIYIDMQHVPENKLTGKSEFMGVYAQYIAFTEKFPVLSVNNGSQFKLDFRTAGYNRWNTVYISGVSERVKDAYYDDVTKLTYVARNGDPNITFMGFNLVHYYFSCMLPDLLTFLNEVFEEQPGEIVHNELVPLEITYEPDQVIIKSQQDQVITGISNLDCFVPADGNEKMEYRNLLVVNSGTTVYDVKYADFKLGLVVTIIGIIAYIFFWRYIRKSQEEVTNE